MWNGRSGASIAFIKGKGTSYSNDLRKCFSEILIRILMIWILKEVSHAVDYY